MVGFSSADFWVWRFHLGEYYIHRWLSDYSNDLFHVECFVVDSVFRGTGPFRLYCQIYVCRIVCSIPLLSCWCLRVYGGISFFIYNIGSLCLLPFFFVSLGRKLFQFYWSVHGTNSISLISTVFFFLFHFVFISCYSFFSLLWIYFALLRDSWDVSIDDWSETFPLFSVSSYCHKFLSQCCFDSVPQILICCTFIFLQFNMLFYFPQIRFISCVLFRNVLFKFTGFWRISCYAFANLWFISILVGTRILYDFSVSTLSRFVSRPRMWAVLDVGFPWICENVVYSAVVWSVL